MLRERFLPHKVLAVLPFYLQACLDDMQITPAIDVPLPLPSHISKSKHPIATKLRTSIEDTPLNIDMGVPFKRRPSAASTSTCSSGGSKAHSSDLEKLILSRNTAPALHSSEKMENVLLRDSARMHLIRSVRMVSQCKEAVWHAYLRLHRDDPVPSLYPPRPKQTTMRDDFETYWTNWAFDMDDRINSRESIVAKIGWSDPGAERPDWRVWSEGRRGEAKGHGPKPSVSSIVSTDQAAISSELEAAADGNPALCRSLRGFVCFKPLVLRSAWP